MQDFKLISHFICMCFYDYITDQRGNDFFLSTISICFSVTTYYFRVIITNIIWSLKILYSYIMDCQYLTECHVCVQIHWYRTKYMCVWTNMSQERTQNGPYILFPYFKTGHTKCKLIVVPQHKPFFEQRRLLF